MKKLLRISGRKKKISSSKKTKTSDLVVIAGPTGSGKTGLVCELDSSLFEVISFDSRQVYKHMEIGTAMPTPEERKKIPHHLVDFLEPDQKPDAASFIRQAETLAREILSRNKTPVIVCGTGFYLKAFLYGMYPVPDIPQDTRDLVLNMPREERLEKLRQLDPGRAAELFPNDDYRISRSLEVSLVGKKWSEISQHQEPGYLSENTSVTGILLSEPREELYKRLNQRARTMIENGLVEETRNVMQLYGADCHGLKTIGYNFALEIIYGKISLESFYEKLAQSHRNYAKKQITWFKKEPLLDSFSREEALVLLKNKEKRLKDVS